MPPQAQYGHTRTSHRCRRWGAGAVAFLVLIGVATEARGPLAAHTGGQQRYVLASTKPGRVCVGTNGTFTVTVQRQFSSNTPSAPQFFRPGITENMDGAVIDATAGNPAIVEITEPTQITGLTGLPATATFTFRGKQPGTTTIDLVARISAMADIGWLGDLTDQRLSVDVIVTNCRFEVSVYSLWHLEAPDAVLDFWAVIDRVVLEAGEDGEFRALGPLQWAIDEQATYNDYVPIVGTCNYIGDATMTDGVLFATMTEDGALTVDVKYDDVPIAFTGPCTNSNYTMTPSALHFEVPNRGGQDVLVQNLNGPVVLPGRARYVVVPLDDSEIGQ